MDRRNDLLRCLRLSRMVPATSPLRWRPLRTLSIDVLPEPLVPMMHMTSPGTSVPVMPSSMTLAPFFWPRFFSFTEYRTPSHDSVAVALAPSASPTKLPAARLGTMVMARLPPPEVVASVSRYPAPGACWASIARGSGVVIAPACTRSGHSVLERSSTGTGRAGVVRGGTSKGVTTHAQSLTLISSNCKFQKRKIQKLANYRFEGIHTRAQLSDSIRACLELWLQGGPQTTPRPHH